MSRASNALKHGLTSRINHEAQSEEVRALAVALLENTRATSTLRAAAAELAGALIHHREVHAYRHYAWNAMTSPPGTTELEARSAHVTARLHQLLAEKGIADPLEGRGPPPTVAENYVLTTLEQLTQMRRLETLARKALSRRTKAIRGFDYELLEARRVDAKTKRSAGEAPSPINVGASENKKKRVR